MPAFLNVDNRAALESLAALERLDAETVLFGHGDPWRANLAAAVAKRGRLLEDLGSPAILSQS